ncbi:hypothetical protein B9Z55_027920 [Caenorhabditis nigoni]|uniref:Uncharacterized protein n=1 Tax=Caenorhabditis nigoni TaxID=1611254 RepID=A0A2G5SE56_9PELO|nr:hypothetical protein B9Z55_027920 [Caenorhabditis nigoni]
MRKMIGRQGVHTQTTKLLHNNAQASRLKFLCARRHLLGTRPRQGALERIFYIVYLTRECLKAVCCPSDA